MKAISLSRACCSTIRLLIALLLFATASLVNAPAAHATDVGGVISTNTTWSLANSPYIVTSNILVNAGVRLTIEPGVVVKFNAGKSLQVDGELIARGTNASRITFTANGGGSPGAWGYILLTDSSVDAVFDSGGNYQSGSIIQYATIEYGGGVNVGNNGTLRMDGSAPYVDRSTVRNSGSTGIVAFNNPGIKLTYDTVTDNGGFGIYVFGSGDVEIGYNVIGRNKYTGVDAHGATVTVENNVISNNGSDGYSYTSGGVTAGNPSTIRGNVISGNTGLYAGGINGGTLVDGNVIQGNSGYWGGGVNGANTVSNNFIAGNSSPQYGGGISDSTTIFRNIIVGNSAPAGAGIYGGAASNNIVAGNVATSGASGYQGSGPLQYNLFAHNSTGDAATVYLQGGGNLANNTLVDNVVSGGNNGSAITVNGAPGITGNNLVRNGGYGLRSANAQGTPNLDAAGNWWNTTNDAAIQALIYDWFDDSTLGIVNYKPFLTAYNTLAPISPPTGVNVTLGASSAALTWSPNPESDTAGYKVYWDTDSGYPYANVITATGTTHTLTGLGAQKYYIAVTAYDTAVDGTDDWTDGNESWFSEEMIADFGPPTFPLTVTLQGGGTGAVTSSPPGVACGSDCSERYGQGVTVVLTATADAGSLFTRWAGACAGTAATCSVTMNTTRMVTATFDLPVQVPDVDGMAQADAQNTLTGAGLTVGTVTPQAHATVPAGSVISQTPPAGSSVAPGTAVNLVVSTGPGSVAVPNVVGATQAQAQAAITGVGLTVGTVITQAHATVPAGSVISQNPAAEASVAPGTAVNLVVSSGPPPAGGDAYEPDNTCAAAKAITATVQHHSFHQAGDADWTHFSAEAGNQYVIETSAVGSQADTVLALFDTCGANTPLASDDYGSSARIVWTAQAPGRYYVRVINHDPSRYGTAASYDLTVRLQPPLAPAVIIVGGHDDSRRLQTNIDDSTDRAYRAFQAGGLSADRIYYLSPDARPGRDAESTSDNLEQAIKVWAADKVGPGVPLYLYMMDHGGKDTFITNGSGDATTASELDAWLDELEQGTRVDKINVIIEACRSGSFIDEVARISQPGRVVIASTSATQNAYASPLGAYFSDAFLTALEDSQSLCSSFDAAQRAVAATGLAQTPWLDDNGNGVANDPTDGEAACGRGLAASLAERPPLIEGVSAPALVSGAEATLRARVQDDAGVAKVWALVYAPSFVEPPPGDTTLKLDLDEIELTDANGDREYEGTYKNFTEKGVYRLVVYAEDGAGFQALPQELTVTAAGTTGSAQLWLPLVAR